MIRRSCVRASTGALPCVVTGRRQPRGTHAAACQARPHGVSCDSWDGMFSLVNPVFSRNTPGAGSLAHLVCGRLGFPYI